MNIDIGAKIPIKQSVDFPMNQNTSECLVRWSLTKTKFKVISHALNRLCKLAAITAQFIAAISQGLEKV